MRVLRCCGYGVGRRLGLAPFALAVLAAVLGVSPASAQGPLGIVVSGTVRRGPGSGAPPVAGAVVTFLAVVDGRIQTATTDAQGRYQLILDYDGDVHITVEADGARATGKLAFNVLAQSNIADVNFNLETNPNALRIDAVVSAASFTPEFAPGSNVSPGGLVSVFGNFNTGGAVLQASQLPLATSLGGYTFRVHQDGFAPLPAYPIFITQTQANLILPGDLQANPSVAPYGNASIVVAKDGAESISHLIVVDPVTLEIFTNPNQRSMGIFTDTNFKLIHWGNSAAPGQYVIAWGSGGGQAPRDNAANGIFDLLPQYADFSIRVAGIDVPPEAIFYHGTDANFPALTQTIFRVPESSPEGCLVDVMLRYRGTFGPVGVSASVGLPITRGGGPCSDPHGLPKDAMQRLSEGLLSLPFFNFTVGWETLRRRGGPAQQRIVAFASALNLTGPTLNMLPPPGACMQRWNPPNAPGPERLALRGGETSVTMPGVFYNPVAANNFIAQFGVTDDFLNRLGDGQGTLRANNLVIGNDSPWTFSQNFNYGHDPWRLNRRLNRNPTWSDGLPLTAFDAELARQMLEEAGFALLDEEPGDPPGGRTADTFIFELTTNDGPRGNYVTTCVSDVLNQPGTEAERIARFKAVVASWANQLEDLRLRVPQGLPPQVVIRTGDNPFHDWNPNGARPFRQFQSFSFQNLIQ